MSGGGLKQSLGLHQSLRMTPQLQQAIKLLQLSRMELEATVRTELEENPILEEAVEIREDDVKRAKEAESEITQLEMSPSSDPSKQDEFDWDSYYEAQNRPAPLLSSGNEEIQNYENAISVHETLHDYLFWQIKMSGFSEIEEDWLTALVGHLDEDGYLKGTLEEISQEENIPVQDLVSILPYLQELDPPGVGARDLKECLILQARFLEEDTHDLVHLINHHLKDLEKKNYDGISKAMGIDIQTVHEMCRIIFSMNPKPGRSFAKADTHYVTPDVYVHKVGDDYIVSMNEDGLPRLKLSNFYKGMLKTGIEKKEMSQGQSDTQTYIQEKIKSAIWLIKSIHQRNRTIYRVAESIVKHQKAFFDHGITQLKPMILKTIADDIGMHESTVSRVTTSKYMYTPQGIFEFKYFFNSGLSSSNGQDDMASEAVKMRIKDLISKEDPKKPLSDQQITEILKADKLSIARRTVAKYREMLKIMPSSQRKKVI